MTYQAPVAQYTFLFQALNVLPAGSAGLAADDLTEVLSTAGRFAQEVLEPLNQVGDREGSRVENGQVRTATGFAKAFRMFADAGWLSADVPESAGGDGLPSIAATALAEFWANANPAFSLCTGLTRSAVVTLHRLGDEQTRHYLPAMLTGSCTGTMNLTEPQAGTDLSAIRTIARPNSDGTWAVSGQKIFITWGDHDVCDNIVHLVLARTPDAPAGLAGLSLFAVPKVLDGKRNALSPVSVEHKLGIHASPTCVMDYAGATGWLVGERHRGLQAMFVMMNEARFAIGVQALGVAERARQRAWAYATDRLQGTVIDRPAGTPIAEHPDVRRLLLGMDSAVTAMRALAVQVAAWMEAGERERVEFFVPVVKGWFAEQAVLVASDAVQVHGGTGYIEETGAAQHLRDARILPIYEGTTAIQANDLVGRKLFRDEGAVVRGFFDDISATAEALAGTSGEVEQRTADRLRRALVAARSATEALAGFGPEGRRSVHAGAVDYLALIALLAGGWLHGRILLSPAASAEGGSDEATVARYRREADHFGAHHLSQVAALAEAVAAGETV